MNLIIQINVPSLLFAAVHFTSHFTFCSHSHGHFDEPMRITRSSAASVLTSLGKSFFSLFGSDLSVFETEAENQTFLYVRAVSQLKVELQFAIKFSYFCEFWKSTKVQFIGQKLNFNFAQLMD